MKKRTRVKIFTDHYPLVGPVFWILSIQYFLTQLLVASAWTIPYNLMTNLISDLGNTVCGLYVERYVCSPLHAMMNASFITLGIVMVVGSTLVFQEFRKTRDSAIGFSFMAIAGIGAILVGLFPENVNGQMHFLGAALILIVGNLGMIILGTELELPKLMRIYSAISGIVGISALILFETHNNLGLGAGTMERLAAYPQTIWLIVFGIYISSNHIRNSRVHKKSGLS